MKFKFTSQSLGLLLLSQILTLNNPAHAEFGDGSKLPLEVPKTPHISGFNPTNTYFACNYDLANLQCLEYSGARLESLLDRRITLFSSIEKCSASCENLIRNEDDPHYGNQLRQDRQSIIEHLPKIYRVIKKDEIQSLKVFGELTWREHEKKHATSTVEGWITHGSTESKEGRAQYSSFSSEPQIFDRKRKYLDQGKNFTEISMKHLADWAEKNNKRVRFPTKSDLELIVEPDGFPTIRIKQDPKAIIIVPISHPEWQDFFMPALWNYRNRNPKYIPGSKTPATASPFAEWFPGKKGRMYSSPDNEVLMVTDRIPIDLISVSSGKIAQPDSAFVSQFQQAQAKMEEKRDEIARKIHERRERQLANQRHNGIDHIPKFKKRTQSNLPLDVAECYGDSHVEKFDPEAIMANMENICKEMDIIMENHLRDLAESRKIREAGAASAPGLSTVGKSPRKRSAPNTSGRQRSQI